MILAAGKSTIIAVMATIRCTARLLKELGTKPSDEADQVNDLCDWHANLLRLNRAKYVLFTNSPTLYCFVVHWRRSSDFKAVFRLGLFKSLMNEGLPQRQIDYLQREHVDVAIAKTNNRAVLGSMNDLAFEFKTLVSMRDSFDVADLSEINRELNRTPLSVIKYKLSFEELKRRLDDAVP